MKITGTFKRSWQLFSGALQVMKQHKQLLFFPLITLFLTFFIILFFMIPAVWESTSGSVRLFYFDQTPSHEWHFTPIGYACAAVLYLVAMSLATFCNVAFYSQIMKALSGGEASVGAGFTFAKGRIRQILVWSLFAGLIGLVISTLEQRFGWVGRIILRVIGMVWSVASAFAIPVIIHDETCNPVRILQNSAQTIKKTWGELLVGYVGLQAGGLIVFLIMFPVMVAILLGAMFLGTDFSPAVYAVGMGLWFALIIALSYFSSVANDIYRCALYLYASEGIVAPAYTADLLNSAWKTKKK